ncbi:MAG: Ppx/GppA family phosphatase [Bdellovibrionales bacterium]
MRVAAIDIGTNSFLCLIADVKNGKIQKVHHDVTRLVRIGEKVHQERKLQKSALERAEKCFAEFQMLIQDSGVEKVMAAATSAARDVSNGHELIDLGKKYQIPIKIISGPQEAEMTYKGMTFDRSGLDGVVGVDIGGGSTEIIHKNSANAVEGQSVDLGCVRLTEMFVTQNPIPEEDLKKLREYAKEKMKVYKICSAKEAIAVAGTPVALVCVEKGIQFDADLVHNSVLTVDAIKKWTHKLSKMSVEERLQVKGLDRGRADVIVAGAILLEMVADMLGIDRYTVSAYGARYGLAIDMEKGLV